MISNSELNLPKAKAIEIEQSHQSSKMKQKRILRRVLKTTLKILVISMQISTIASANQTIDEKEIHKLTLTLKSKKALSSFNKIWKSKPILWLNYFNFVVAICYAPVNPILSITFSIGLLGSFFKSYY